MTSSRKHVLIIEDDAIQRRGLARLFREGDFDVTQLEDGRRAVDSIANQLPVLILCDYRLPGVDGLEILSLLVQKRIAIPFILITAHFSDELEKAAAERGAAAVLEKPIDLKQLRKLCRQLLGT